MPIQMPKEALITIQKRSLPADFHMPQMEMAESHYSIGFVITGDRRIITPYQQFDAHSTDVIMMPPLIYHRTFAISEIPYENYLIKISASVYESFCHEVDKSIWDKVFEQKLFRFSGEDAAKIEAYFADMLSVYREGRPYSEVILKGLLYRLLLLISELDKGMKVQQFKSRLSNEILESTFYLEQHYAEPVRLGEVAKRFGFSEGHFSRLFSAQVGVPFSNYLINIRIRHAKELLINTDKSVSEISMDIGFSSADYFSACFSKCENMTPSAFRRANNP